MKKESYFASERTPDWPAPDLIKRYFVAPKGEEWFLVGGNDTAGLRLIGLDGTENLELGGGRIDIRLSMWGKPSVGVYLQYTKSGGPFRDAFASRGDLSKLREYVESAHGDLLPLGLFIPFSEAWKAVKEFIETDGQLPRGIEWIANRDLPPNTFPDP